MTEISVNMPKGSSPSPGSAMALLHTVWRTVRHDNASFFALLFILLMVFTAVFAPLIAPHDPIAQNIVNAFQGSSASHWFGTDEYGRDVFSRIIYGARPALLVGVLSVALAMVVGIPIGMFAGLHMGWLDRVVGWCVDIMLAFPALLMALLAVTLLGSSLPMLVVAISISSIPVFIRLARSLTLVTKNLEFVHMARSFGASSTRIVAFHIFPNIIGPIIVMGTLSIAGAVREEASLSFLGMGVLPPAASWGNLIRDGIVNIFDAPSLAVLPGIVLTLAVLAFNMVGDTLRDILDPRGLTKRKVPAKKSRVAGIMNSRSKAVQDGATPLVAPLLNVDQLRVAFNTDRGLLTVVDGVSFSVNAGEVLAVVGESGCGKSVTALSILKLAGSNSCVTGGSIQFEGRDLAGLSANELRHIRGNQIGYIFQEPMTSMNPVFTIGEQLMEPLMRHRNMSRAEATQEAVRLLDMVNIPLPASRLREYPHQLSGGMRQRVMIAMAISCQPKLLIADEPTTALDVTVQAQILELLKNLQREMGMAMILITHNMGVVAEFSDRVAVMYAGRVAEIAATEMLFKNPRHPYTQALLRSIPSIDSETDRLVTLPGTVPNPAAMPTGCRFFERCEYAKPPCKETLPGLMTVAEQHTVACIRDFDYRVQAAGEAS